MATLSYNPPVLDLVVYAGDDTSIPMAVTAAGEGVNLTGEHQAQIRATRDGDLLGSFTINYIDLSNGELQLILTSELSNTLVENAVEVTDYFGNDIITAPMFQGVWDWHYTVGTVTKTLAQGKITVIKDVTR
jgi:hypothetical protein